MVLMGLLPHLAACGVFAMVLHGWAGALFLLLFALFSWFLLPVQWAISFVQWLLYVKFPRSLPWVTASLAVAAAIALSALGRLEAGEVAEAAIAFASAGAASVLVSAGILWLEYQRED